MVYAGGRGQICIEHLIHDCPQTEAILSKGLSYHKSARLFSEQLKLRVLPGLLHHYLKMHPDVKEKYLSAKEQQKENAKKQARASLAVLAAQRELVQSLEARLLATTQDKAMDDLVRYLRDHPARKQTASALYQVFQGYHNGLYAKEIERLTGVKDQSIRMILAGRQYACKDGRTQNHGHRTKLSKRMEERIRRQVPVLGYHRVARELNLSVTTVRHRALMNGIKSPFKPGGDRRKA